MAHRIIPHYLQLFENGLLNDEHDYEMYEQLLSFILNIDDPRPMHTLKSNQQLMSWIIEITPKLVDSDEFKYELSTRCNWILNGRSNFPICRFCQTQFGMNRNMPFRYDYSQWCSNRCRQTDPIVVARTKTTKFKNHGDENYCNTQKIAESSMKHFGVSNPNKCREVREKIENTNMKNFGYKCIFESPIMQEKIRQTNIKNRGVACPLSDPIVREKGVQTWIKNYGVDHPQRSDIVKQKIRKRFMEHYGVDHNMKSKEGFDAWQSSVISKYGVNHPLKCPEIRKKIYRKYIYDNQTIDSAPELAFYIWLKDMNIEFEYQPAHSFVYEYHGKQHYYFPDFKVDDMFFEIKGDQFFDKDGKMRCPYRNKDTTDEEYEYICGQFEAKHQCMLENNVVIFRSNEYNIFLHYIAQTYSKDYLKRFRVKHLAHRRKLRDLSHNID